MRDAAPPRPGGVRKEKAQGYEQQEPRRLVRIVGQAPLTATVYELQRLRCNLCGEVYSADAPEGVGEDMGRLQCELLKRVFFWLGCLQDQRNIEQQGETSGIALDDSITEMLVNRIVAIRRFCDTILDDFNALASDILQVFPNEFAELVRAKVARSDLTRG